jgi:ADP-L-glycero-D-manno-heptose 6-epimerase
MELMEKRPTSGIYNMGFGTARSWLDLAGNVFQALNLQQKINWIEMPENIKNQYQYFTEADMSKWQSNGMSKPIWSLEKAIPDYINNYLNSGSYF